MDIFRSARISSIEYVCMHICISPYVHIYQSLDQLSNICSNYDFKYGRIMLVVDLLDFWSCLSSHILMEKSWSMLSDDGVWRN